MKIDIKKYLTISALVIAVQINAADLSIQSYKQHWRWQQSGVDKNVIDNFLELFDDYQQPLAQRFSSTFGTWLGKKGLVFPTDLALKVLNRATKLDSAVEIGGKLNISYGGIDKLIRVENLNTIEFVKSQVAGHSDTKSGEQIIHSFDIPERKFSKVLPYIQCWIGRYELRLDNDVENTSRDFCLGFQFDGRCVADGINKKNNFCAYIPNQFAHKHENFWLFNIHPNCHSICLNEFILEERRHSRTINALALQYGANKVIFFSTLSSQKEQVNNKLHFLDIALKKLRCQKSFHADTQYAFTKLCWITGKTAIGLTADGKICTINVNTDQSEITVDAPKIIKDKNREMLPIHQIAVNTLNSCQMIFTDKKHNLYFLDFCALPEEKFVRLGNLAFNEPERNPDVGLPIVYCSNDSKFNYSLWFHGNKVCWQYDLRHNRQIAHVAYVTNRLLQKQ